MYLYKNMMTPYEKLKSLPNAKKYLKPGISFIQLDKIMMNKTDLQAAKDLKAAQAKLFRQIFSSTCP